MTEISIGGVPISKPKTERLSLLIWGPAGFGKTTLAATMPGRKALINFDPDGPLSVNGFDDLTSFDLSGEPDSIVAKFIQTDGLKLEDAMKHFDSFIIDSLTSITEKTLARGISITKGATLERPSPGAYMARNNIAIHLIRNILAITARHNKHVCFIAHEGPPQTNDDGGLIGYTMSLGGQLPSATALRINECWATFEDSKNRKMIICRKARLRDPVKSRMFDTTKSPEFEWKFDPNDPMKESNMRIDRLYEQWKAAGFRKIPLPT